MTEIRQVPAPINNYICSHGQSRPVCLPRAPLDDLSSPIQRYSHKSYLLPMQSYHHFTKIILLIKVRLILCHSIFFIRIQRYIRERHR
ncbi:hypothetical protein HOLleu_21109 [Holothuria leucospilota]|uniref:Uncharacterized protein n=1 Tax=Holothuria leucospilota TaxID=206669 RepID=A0A9Q1BX94_HOLLE|nr:hypothetical protein HOLleu_21109 [Holothuria leucospilota]